MKQYQATFQKTTSGLIVLKCGITRTYIGYTVNQAKQRFKDELKRALKLSRISLTYINT